MPLGPPEDPNRFEDFDECVAALQEDDNLSQEEAERVCGAWETDSNTSDYDMTDSDEPQYRQHHQPDPAAVTIRDDIEDDGMFGVRMPIASTGEVRNEGDDPLTRDELEGMARQLETRQIGTFPAHGADSKIASGRYSPFEKLGFWEAGEVETRSNDQADEADVLMAEARMPDPETLPPVTGSYREGLAILKEQAERGIALSSSIGWREDDNSPGGIDLMEASIVGIPADPRTDTSQATATTVARAAIDAGADPEALVRNVKKAVRSPSLGHTYGPITKELSHEGVSLAEGELYCHDTGEVNDVGGPRSKIECPACGEVLDGAELMADLNTDSGSGRSSAAVMGPNANTDIHDLTSQQAEQAIDLLERFIDSQGEASVRNFENWLWEIDDDDADDDAIHAAHSSLEEFYRANSPMDESVTDSLRGWLEDQASGAEDTNDMTNDTESSDEQSEESTDESTEQRDAPEWAERMLDLQEQTVEALDALRQDDDDEEDEDEEEEGEQETDEDEEDEDEEDDEEQSVDPDLKAELERLKDELDDLRSNGLTDDDVEALDALRQDIDESDQQNDPSDDDLAELEKYPL